MRSVLTILLLCLTTALTADVKVTLEPKIVAVGEYFTLWLSNDGRETPQIADFPDVNGIRWYPAQRSSRTEIINGRASSSIGYRGQALAEGRITIPAFKVIVGRRTVTSEPLTLEVGKAGARQQGEVSLDEAVFADGRYLTGNRAVYVGEEVPVEVTLYTMDGIRVQIAWPELNFDKVAFRDFKEQFPQNPRFSGMPARDYSMRDNIRFITQTFRSAIRPLGIGELKGSVEINTEVQIPNRNRRASIWDDDFFGFGSTRTASHAVRFDFPPLTVKALPPAPAEAFFLGLLGDWKLDYELTQDEFRAGDPFTLAITVQGHGSLDNLSAPKLEFPGFRVYPPEVEKKAGGASIKYVIIPLRPGEDTLRLKTAFFDLNEEKYRVADFERSIKVLPAAGLIQGTSVSQPIVEGAAAKSENLLKMESDSVSRSNILYLKKDASHMVARPLYLNNLIWLLLLALGGPLVFAICEMRCLHRDRLNSDPAILRRRKALAARGRMRRLLQKTPSEKISHVIQAEVVPVLNDYLGLPPGTTATELAEIVKNPELAQCLRNSGSAGFMPGVAAVNHGELKSNIIKALRYISFFLVLLVPAGAAAMSEEQAAAFNAYDSGDFKAAAEYFRSQILPGKVCPNALYNLGNALCQDGRLGEALACYERARLLAPRDTDIGENLNYVRRQLLQPECGQVSTPGELMLFLRDSLRPDNWLLVLAGAWSCFWLLAAFRRRLGFNRKLLMLIIIGVGAIIAVTALCTQLRGPYAGNRAIVLYNGTKLRSLPSEQSGKVERTLQEGERVGIVESRRDWVLVRLENAEGWLKSGDMEVIR